MDEQAVFRLLIQVLEEKGIPWQSGDGFVRFLVRRGGMEWEVDCLCRGGSVELYGRYPFRVSDRDACEKRCADANLRLSRGAMVLPRDGRPVYRDFVEMDDPYGAADRLRRALEWNFRAVAWFWDRMEKAAGEAPTTGPAAWPGRSSD